MVSLQAIMKSIFPAAIDGDLLKLVHLSNGFRMVDGAKCLAVGDVCKAEARIVSVINANEGKIVKVKGFVYRQGQRVIESFLYRGRFTDYENTFDTTEEPDYLVPLETDAAVGVLNPKSGLSGKTSLRRFLLELPSSSAFNHRYRSKIGQHTAMSPCLAMFSLRTS